MLRTSATRLNSVLGNNSHYLYGNDYTENKKLVDMYKKLAAIVVTTNMLLNEYSVGHFDIVATILTQYAYNKLSIDLAALAVPSSKYPDFETIRGSCTTSLTGMWQSIIQYDKCMNTERQLELALERASILDDPVKLKAYIDSLKNRHMLFPESKVTVMAATLKPEYAAYIQKYGFPAGAVFEPDKLAFILEQLNMVAQFTT